MINSKYLKILFKNKRTRKLFEIKKSLFFGNYTCNDLLMSSKTYFMSEKVEVLYVVFPLSINDGGYERHLCKIIIKSNLFEFCSMHRYSTCEKLKIKYANESHLVDYMKKHDRNMTICFGSVFYL
jgi:hypothetical protein